MSWIAKFQEWIEAGKPALSPEPTLLTIEEAIDKEELMKWASNRKNVVVGIGVKTTECPIANYIKDVTGANWVSVSPSSFAYQLEDGGMLNSVVNPDWLYSVVNNIDRESGRHGDCNGSRVLAIVKQVIKRGY